MRSCQFGMAVLIAALVLWPVACRPARAQNSGSSRDPDPSADKGSVVDFDSVLRMLRQGVDEKIILRKLEESPTRFTLSGTQIGELKDAGASGRLIKAMQAKSATGSISSDVTDYALILDCSGSMNDKMPDGGTKMEAAKKVVTEFIRELPNGKRLTFIVYGHRVYGNDKQRGCKAVEVALPLRPLNADLKEQLGQLIDQLRAKGWTPLAASLHLAGQELKKAQGMCQVIVVTDGMETCGGDPAQEAADLNKQLKLPGGVDIIGFNVTPDEKDAVKKIVDEGRGRYYDSTTVKDLIANLHKVVERPKINLLLGTNLIVNPGAEAGKGDTGARNRLVDIPGWRREGRATVIQYDPKKGSLFPSPASPGPAERGKNLFIGGSDNRGSALTQEVDFTPFAEDIDAGRVSFVLTAYLGGFAKQADHAVLTVTFLDDAGKKLDEAQLGPVTVKERRGVTGLLKRSKRGPVPRGVRRGVVRLHFTRFEGVYNDGSADNLSLVFVWADAEKRSH